VDPPRFGSPQGVGARTRDPVSALHVVSLIPLPAVAREQIAAVDPSIELHVAAGWFNDDVRETWGDHVADSYLLPARDDIPPRDERNAVLANADVVLGGFPLLVDLVARAPRLRWVHQTPAGASNLHRCDLWGGDIPVSTSRGLGNTLAIAEYVVGSFLHFARGFHHAGAQREQRRFERAAYRPTLLGGKQVCVIGAGGIGQDVGRLCSALGMRVVGTRRTIGGEHPEGFDEVASPDQLHRLLADSSFVAICCQWTPETTGLMGTEEFAALPDGAIVANVARGEIIDEAALAASLDRLGGAALDVYVGEFSRNPPDELWAHPKCMITPHVSAGADERSARPIRLFCRNLRALIDGRPLDNVIDWERGY